MAPRNYGSVLIHFRNGEITGITEKIDYNPDSFIETVSKPLIPVVVRSYKKKMDSKSDKKKTVLSQSGEKQGQYEQKEDKKDNFETVGQN